MIGRLQGILLEKQPPEILIEVNGVGYELLLPMTSFYALPEVNQPLTLFTHLVVREDAHQLYGFCHKSDRSLFRELIKTNGVGPKLALAILSFMSVEEFTYAIENEEVSRLTKIAGVGKKTAERLVVELKGKFKGAKGEFFVSNHPLTPEKINPSLNSVQQDAISALITLGYKASEAEKMVAKIKGDNLSSEQLIREALKGSL